MATQAETVSFPSVYQWETTDPVLGGLGGVANLPLLQLTARTRFTLDKATALEAAVELLAPKNSPLLTGTPRAPTPPRGSNGTEVATAGFVRAAAGGIVTVAITGNRYLTAEEAGSACIIVVGVLTADAFLLFPDAPGRWTVFNATAGGFQVRARLSYGGAFQAISGGTVQTVFSNGGDVFPAHSDYRDAFLSGIPTAPTAPDGTNTIQVASTAFARRAAALATAGEAAIRDAQDAAINAQFANYVRLDSLTGNRLNNGFQVLPSGLIEMWGGYVSATGVGDVMAFPISFPNACLAVVGGERNSSGWGQPPSPTSIGVAQVSREQFRVHTVRHASGNPVPFYESGIGFTIRALGY